MKTKKVVKIISGAFCMLLMLVLLMQTDVLAAGTVTVTADRTNVSVGETIVVTVKTSTPEDPATLPEVSVTYNPDVLNFAGCNVEFGGGGGLVTFKGESAILTFTTSQTGVATVGAEAIIDDDGANPAVGNTMISIGANAAEGLSDDATLYVLEMDPGQLVPEFSSDVTEYQIIVGNDVTDITVSGAVSNPGAQITTASGFKNLKEGTNQALITVTAASGTMLTYHFTIVRGEPAEQTPETTEPETEEPVSEPVTGGLDVTIDGQSYTVQSVIPEEAVPDGCVKTTSTFNGKPVEAVLFEKGGLTLLYALTPGSESGDFFVYNEGTGKLSFFIQIYNVENRYIVPIEAQDAAPVQFKEAQMPWNDFLLPAFALEDTSVEHAQEFYLLYAVSNEGERGFYLYDSVEGTYQRFLNYTGAKMAAAPSTEGGVSKNVILVIAVLAILLLGAFVLIVNMIVKNKELQEDALYEKKRAPKKVVKKEKEKKQQPKLEPKPVVRKPEPKPAMKKTVVPEPVEEPVEPEVKVVEKPIEKPVEKPVETPTERTEEPKIQARPVPTVQPSRPVIMHTDHVVSLKPRQVEGTVGITGNIPPVKIVQTPKSEVRNPSVPIFTLDKPGDALDDDFEFEFINIDSD